jgi:hypothetical protein
MQLKTRYPSVMMNEFIYGFEKTYDEAATPPSLLDFQFNVGDHVVISTEQGHLALAIGVVCELSHTQIVLKLDRELRGPPVKKEWFSSAYIAIDDPITCPQTQCERGILYRIDKDEPTSGMSLMRWTLMRLIEAPEYHRLRSLIIELSEPEYRPEEATAAAVVERLDVIHRLNRDQKEALCRVLTGKYVIRRSISHPGECFDYFFLSGLLIIYSKGLCVDLGHAGYREDADNCVYGGCLGAVGKICSFDIIHKHGRR